MDIGNIEKVVYVCHEYGGNPENAEKVARLITALAKEHPEICFVSPIHSFGFMYNDVSYEKGMEYCLVLLDMSDEIWVFGDKSNSRGCRIEKAYSKRYRIPIIERGDYDGN